MCNDSNVEFSLHCLEYSRLMAYLIIWQRKKNKFAVAGNREYLETDRILYSRLWSLILYYIIPEFHPVLYILGVLSCIIYSRSFIESRNCQEKAVVFKKMIYIGISLHSWELTFCPKTIHYFSQSQDTDSHTLCFESDFAQEIWSDFLWMKWHVWHTRIIEIFLS